MKKNKYIKEIAKNLPVVMDQTVSGFYMDFDENGEEKIYPNLVSHPINHERRIRKAYETLGMEGVKQYLHKIYTLQNEYLQHLQRVQQQELPMDNQTVDPVTGSADSQPEVQDPNTDNQEVSSAD